MRQIKRIFVHCTAGSQRQTIDDLKAEFHRTGWSNPGYHYVIDTNGGVQGYNSTAINVAYIGGIDADGKPIDNRTPAQKDALVLLLHKLKQKFPTAQIMGHRDIWGTDQSNWRKMCPCFNSIQEYKDIA